MTLNDYLIATGQTELQLAKALKVDRSTIYRWRRHQRTPKAGMMTAIHAYTKGQVTPVDLLPRSLVDAP
jgi:transcriptional regulator with XRE-family HTH domain